MSLILNGTTGISDVDGTAAAPALTGTDSNTGIFFPAADTIAFAEGGAEAMRIDASGNVGIGVTPAFKLDISGSGTTSKFNTLDTHDGGASISTWQKVGRRAGTGTNAYINTVHSGSDAVSALTWAFGTSGTGTEAMRIDSSGNLLVGTTSQINSGLICAQGSLNSVNTFVCKNTVAQGSGQSFAYFANSAGNKAGSIDHTGTTTVAYTTSSDYRMKENIAPMTGALTAVSQLKPCTYTWKEDGKAGQGFIAHELQAVVPDCVSGEKDAVDAEGNSQYQGIDTSFLVATLTAAIQEQQATIVSLQDTLTALTTRITALEAA